MSSLLGHSCITQNTTPVGKIRHAVHNVDSGSERTLHNEAFLQFTAGY